MTTLGYLQEVITPKTKAVRAELLLRPLAGYTRFSNLDQELGNLQIISDDIAKRLEIFHTPIPIEIFRKFGAVKSFSPLDIGVFENSYWGQGIQVKNVKKGNHMETLVILTPHKKLKGPDNQPIVLTLNYPDPAWVEKIVKFFILQEKQWQQFVNK